MKEKSKMSTSATAVEYLTRRIFNCSKAVDLFCSVLIHNTVSNEKLPFELMKKKNVFSRRKRLNTCPPKPSQDHPLQSETALSSLVEIQLNQILAKVRMV